MFVQPKGSPFLVLIVFLFYLFLPLVDSHFKPSIIPVDHLANSLILTGWHAASYPEERKLVVHLTIPTQHLPTFEQIFNFGRPTILSAPSIKIVRPLTRNPVNYRNFFGKMNHLFTKLFSHILFAYLLDLVVMCTGNRRFMVKLTEKMHRALDVIAYFGKREWHFQGSNFRHIWERLSPEEQESFQCDGHPIDWSTYYRDACMGSRRYLLKEDDSTIEAALKRQKRLIFIYGALKMALYVALIALVGFIWSFSL